MLFWFNLFYFTTMLFVPIIIDRLKRQTDTPLILAFKRKFNLKFVSEYIKCFDNNKNHYDYQPNMCNYFVCVLTSTDLYRDKIHKIFRVSWIINSILFLFNDNKRTLTKYVSFITVVFSSIIIQRRDETLLINKIHNFFGTFFLPISCPIIIFFCNPTKWKTYLAIYLGVYFTLLPLVILASGEYILPSSLILEWSEVFWGLIVNKI